MRVEVVMPKMGESLQEGTILRWLKKEGDKVDRDEMILEISTDKVDTEVPSPVSGVLAQILAKENETIEVGKVIAYIETEAGAAQSPTQNTPVPEKIIEVAKVEPIEAGNSSLVDVVMPKMGESLQEGTILKWLKKEGDKVERDEMILEISTDKVDTEVPSPVSGTLVQILAKENETVEVGKVIARISTGAATPKATPQMQAQTSDLAHQTVAPNIPQDSTTEIPRSDGDKFFSPLVRSIAETEAVTLEELRTIKGSGLDNRVTKDDLLNYIKNRGVSSASPSNSAITKAPEVLPAQIKPAPVVTQKPTATVVWGADDEIIPMDRVRQLISEHMVYSKHTSAHVTSVAEADVSQIVKFRNKNKASFEKQEGFKLTFTPFFLKAVVEGVKAFPMVNVSVDGKNIIHHRRINLSFATALNDGNLIVPVIKNAESLNITGLARSVYDLSTRARTKKLNPDDIQGGTITLTNVGTFGTLFGTPVINQPQAAIIGVGAIQKRPVVKDMNGESVIVVRDMMYVSITYDHRVIDGMLAGQCLAAIVKSMEAMQETTIDL